MAEGFLKSAASDIFEVYSAGTEPKPIHPLAIKVMKEIGIDISDQKSKDLTEYLGKVQFDYVITLCDNANESCPTIWTDNKIKDHWSFDDPASFEGNADEKLEEFRRVRDAIKKRIDEWVREIKKAR